MNALRSAYEALYRWMLAGGGDPTDEVLVLSHVRPDGDSLGAQTAIHHLLTVLGRPAAMANADPPPKRFDYLPAFHAILPPEAFSERLERHGRFRRAIFVDCADRERIGAAEALLDPEAEIVNIDHHATNDGYGHINVVRPDASSTSEVVYDFVRAVGLPLDQDLATALYTGILTDTGGFRYQNTSPKVLHDAAELVERGAEPYFIAEHALETMSLSQVRLLARALSDIRLVLGGRVALVEVTEALLRETGADLDASEGLVHYARNIEGVEVAVLFREQSDGIKVSFRSRRTVDVAALARQFGGGGHVRAAGALLPPPLSAAREAVIRALEAVL
ncbi:bifunctional oligoribonuclease/PAP phosphatase NrnA [Hydrogenibacillus sp. N12]|uniref:DHH family phosphoesterase n=1 Tax=Hydrogenibacillus sp. N12 TaxID=2866627 RepID=UPI001C7D96B7|nr:bifunctional oligoribonuclease/PAP phosphatase NrnA [Hydrogenibacillus sp. N12]QZA33709.1 bifunctional oligoribonuclease/PAP phosphatase NrnA [Hydrogenibacillus sp. N12]